MSVSRRGSRLVALAAVTATVLGVTACGSDDSGGSDASGKPDKLVVETFGEFGYDELVKQYEKDTGIKIELRKTAQLNEYRPKVVRSLATGKGIADVVALEEGILNEFKTNPANWADLTPLVKDHSTEYLPWKWELGKAGDGRLMGLPTDVGSLAVCYRSDLFKAAGLPTERDAVTALWPDWPAFIETGKKYREKTGKGLLDSVTTASSAITMQIGGDIFYDAEDNIVADKSASVKQAWDTSLQDGRRQHHREDGHLVAGVERGLQAGHVRRHLLSFVDARHRAGQLRRGEQGQVGRRRCARRVRQLGWLVARCA